MQIGCQGWNYADWVTKAGGQTVFYPRGTRPGEMLEIYAQTFETVEVDSTFYAIPSVATLKNWDEKTPPDFTFAFKLPQEITHEKGLESNSFYLLEEFCENIEVLREKLAVVLIQLPPAFDASPTNFAVFKSFLAQLPRHIRFAVEFRHRSWIDKATLEVLQKRNVALCLVEGNWIPRQLIFEAAKTVTADFIYARFMGERDLTDFSTVHRPQEANLQIWYELLNEISQQVAETFVYFSNFYEGHSPSSANQLKKLCGQKIIEPIEFESQPSLF
jgi:uncharacterized protein YecE (DUF72 family)